MPPVLSDAGFTQDQRMIVEAVREFARTELLPLDWKPDEGESSLDKALPRLAEMGLLNLCVPEELNGLGLPCRVYAAILHEIAMWAPSMAVTISVHSMVGNSLRKYATDALRSDPLPRWGEADQLGAFCLTEAGAGSDAKATKTIAVAVDGGYRITGEKLWITNGLKARWFLMLTRLQDVPDDQGLCAFLIDGNEPGIERTKVHGKMGLRASETAVIHLNDVFVPEEHLIGKRGEGLQVFLVSLNEGRIGIAAQSTGISEACLNEMVSYARQREQFGKPIGKFQAIAEMIAQSAVELEASKVLTRRAANRIDAGKPDRVFSSMAKLYASESANRIAYRAVQVHGGAGYVDECRVEQLYRDARVTTIYEGTSEIQRIVIARGLGRK